MIEVVRDLDRPEAAVVASEEIALDRLAESGRAPARVYLPAGRENERATQRDMRPLRSSAFECDDIVFATPLVPCERFDTGRLGVDRPDVFHVFSPQAGTGAIVSYCLKKSGLWVAISP